MCSTRSALMIKVHPWHRWDLLSFEAACFLDICGGVFWCGRCPSNERWNENHKEKEKDGSLQFSFGPRSLSSALFWCHWIQWNNGCPNISIGLMSINITVRLKSVYYGFYSSCKGTFIFFLWLPYVLMSFPRHCYLIQLALNIVSGAQPFFGQVVVHTSPPPKVTLGCPRSACVCAGDTKAPDWIPIGHSRDER